MNGATSEIRTQDLLITSQPLYRAKPRWRVVMGKTHLPFIIYPLTSALPDL